MASADLARKRLRVIEDQAAIRKLIRMRLEFKPCQVHEAADGATGLRRAVDRQPDLVLLDVMMPGELDGLQVCERVRGDPGLAAARVVDADGAHPPAIPGSPVAGGRSRLSARALQPLQQAATIDHLLAPG